MTAARYRLRGEVGGSERCYSIGDGELRVGCVGTNDVVLPLRGVSRTHARLASGPEGVEVEDLDSRNGVFVNGARVTRGRLRPGDRVRFGPVTLTLEETSTEESELAIRLVDALRPQGLSPWETTTSEAAESGPASDRLVLSEAHVMGASPAMTALYAQIRAVADSELPVLITGETGVGKEHVARAIHASSRRSRGPFVAVNCAAIPAELMEAEVFGVAKGVATGVAERAGKLVQASGGTLFLDEIGEMPLALQPKLLRALQDKENQPLGGPVSPVDVRTLAATNAELPAKLAAGAFRRDLYFRIAGVVLHVPPLRERAEDIPGLVEAFLHRFAREDERAPSGLSRQALALLCEYPWPGNVRELEHEVRRLVHACAHGQAIDSGMLSATVRTASAAEPGLDGEAATLAIDTHLQRLEDRLIREALRRSAGNRSQAAKLLGISRNGLALKMERLGIAG